MFRSTLRDLWVFVMFLCGYQQCCYCARFKPPLLMSATGRVNYRTGVDPVCAACFEKRKEALLAYNQDVSQFLSERD